MSAAPKMDLISSCKDKLAYFRIKELKDVLTQLGLSKQGKKQDLVDRILAILSDERVSGMWAKKNAVGKEDLAKLVDDIYRKMQVSGATELASKAHSASDSRSTRLKQEPEDSYQMEKIRCLCGSSLQNDTMIKCEDPKCHVWQHIGCVIIPEKPMEGVQLAVPDHFYCEICRLKRADPFLFTTGHPLYPVKLTPTNSPTDGTNPVQTVERTFHLTRAEKDFLLRPEYDIQAWCMLLNDKVPFRIQWPQYPELQVNGLPARTINRPGSQLLGANGRDDGSYIKQHVGDGVNKICLTGCDSRMFCFGVRIIKRRTVQQVLSLIPEESEGEQFEDALARVRRCVGGGTAMENADSDSDLEIVADSIPVNLRCPMSGSRMKVAGRFKPCLHMGCFDLEVFVEMNQRSRKWQCPICLKNYTLENIIIDPYFNRITSKMRNCGEDVTDIEVKPDGSWRAKADGDRRDLGDLGLWHFSDGILCPLTDDDVEPKSDAFKNIKPEGVSDIHASLKLGMKKNRNGCWEFSKPEDMHGLSSSYKLEKFENNGQNVIPMSSSATGSGRDGEDPSVNQDGGGNCDFSANNGIELDSIPLNNGIDQNYLFSTQIQASLGDAEVIVLSDSEEENDGMISGTVYKNSGIDTGGVTFPPPHRNLDSYPDDLALGSGASPCLGHFNTNVDEYGMPFWPLTSGAQAGSSFQLFGTEADVSDTLVDLQNGPINCPPSTNGYTSMAEAPMGSAARHPESSVSHPNADLNDGLVDNPLAYGGDDPPLQLFLPTRPSDASIQPSLRDQSDAVNSIRSEDWISLRLGGGSSTSHGGEFATANGLNSQQQLQSNEGAMDSLADTASLLCGMDDNTSGKTSRERSDSPFSFPRQRRSVRPRLYLSINSDSD